MISLKVYTNKNSIIHALQIDQLLIDSFTNENLIIHVLQIDQFLIDLFSHSMHDMILKTLSS